jgi:hypothetical protein
MRVGTAELPLHGGECPRWLFKRMTRLGRLIFLVIERDYGTSEFLKRISDPFWFQAFGCVLGFDWHSSGVTTTVCGALKEALGPEDGFVVLGGKGKVSRNTPEEIEKVCEIWNFSTQKMESLIYASRMAAKVDNSVLQDGYQLYHHSFFLTEKGRWAVVQQGMNEEKNYARRYHWIDENVGSFVDEPHAAICCDKKEEVVLNMVAQESEGARKASVEIVRERGSIKVLKDLPQTTLVEYGIKMPKNHFIDLKLYKKLNDLSEFQPKNYEELVSLKGVGPKTIRALALLSDLIYGEKPSWKDPVKYSFAHGGKDGTPFPVDRKVYDESIEILKNAIEEAKLGDYEKTLAIKRLKNYLQTR